MRKLKIFQTVLTLLCGALCGVCVFTALSVSSLFSAKAETTFNAISENISEKMTTEGASVRVSTDGKSGIRFHVRVNLNADGTVDFDGGAITVDELNTLETAILVKLREGNYEAVEVDRKGAWVVNKEGGFAEIKAYVYNIEEEYYDKDFAYCAYYINDDGEVVCTEWDYRNLSYVAMMAKKELSNGEWTGLNTLYNEMLTGENGDELNDQLNSYLPANRIGDSESFGVNDYIYRVGNGNKFKASSLFTLTGTEGVAVEESLVCASESVTLTENSDGTYKFEGTGIVDLTLTEKYSRNTVELTVEVVDAVNATVATSATANNVVLLNNVDLHTLEVSNGYTLYGNGFKMEAKNDVRYDTRKAGYVTLNNGTLDNVQIVCPNFSYSILYESNIQDNENDAKPVDPEKDASSGNVRSAVYVRGNSSILNSYVSGGRAAIYVADSSSDFYLENSTVEGGAAANIHIITASSVVLKNITLIQKPKQATVNDTSKTVMGFSIVNECDEEGNAIPITLEGEFFQYAWVNEDYKQYVPSNASSIVSAALKKTDFLHTINGKQSLNLGIVYIPANLFQSVDTPTNLSDNRTNKDNIPYGFATVSSACVYSYTNGKGTSMEISPAEYTPNAQSQKSVLPTVTYSDTNTARVYETKYDEDSGWSSSLTVDLDKGNYEFSFDKLVAKKFGEPLSYSVKTEDGTTVDTTKSISLTASGVTKYVLTITDNVDNDVKHTYYFTLTATKTSIPDPVAADTTGGTPLLVVKSKNSDWSCAIPALEGIKIKYYGSNGETILDLATLTPSSTGKQNGTNNYWETTKDGYKLKVTCGVIHDGKSVYGMPVVVDNNGTKQIYFTISSTNGYVSTGTSGRTVTLTYEFTDPNGKTLTFSKTWQVNYADYKEVAQYSYSDFVNGTLTDLLASSDSGSSTCIAAGTLITLADGTQKKVEDIVETDILLVFDHETGKYVEAPITFIERDGWDYYDLINLEFSNGTKTRLIYEHGLFDLTLNKYVYVREDNYESFIGHEFAMLGENGSAYETVTLERGYVTNEYTGCFSLVTVYHLNYYIDGLLSMPGGISGLFNYFEYGEGLKYDEEQMQADIEKYGLFTYEDFEDYIPYEIYEYVFPAKYYKVAMGKGMLTWEDIFEMIERYLIKNDVM